MAVETSTDLSSILYPSPYDHSTPDLEVAYQVFARREIPSVRDIRLVRHRLLLSYESLFKATNTAGERYGLHHQGSHWRGCISLPAGRWTGQLDADFLRRILFTDFQQSVCSRGHRPDARGQAVNHLILSSGTTEPTKNRSRAAACTTIHPAHNRHRNYYVSPTCSPPTAPTLW